MGEGSRAVYQRGIHQQLGRHPCSVRERIPLILDCKIKRTATAGDFSAVAVLLCLGDWIDKYEKKSKEMQRAVVFGLKE